MPKAAAARPPTAPPTSGEALRSKARHFLLPGLSLEPREHGGVHGLRILVVEEMSTYLCGTKLTTRIHALLWLGVRPSLHRIVGVSCNGDAAYSFSMG